MDLWGCVMAGPLSSDFWGARSDFCRQLGDLCVLTGLFPQTQQRTSDSFCFVFVRAENPRPNKREGFSSSKHHRSLSCCFPFSFSCVVHSALQTMLILSPGRKLSSEHDVMVKSSDVRLAMRL